ncbi:BLUF domain-containing protein [Methylobacterium sp. WCS2018Hpa-22]|uniref:BLUF domain-containing protein n=1 Tax=Methylobacterium sp. WCS2018Hpa-22 TaxID=3073633 RepID=UPI00288B0C32|nr:BLUF domain-containing protein [Methylobacterium sp. WCS2018Hpa-22]
MPLSQFVFYSRNLVKLTGGSMRDMVRDILASCNRYDHASGMTGALVFNEDFFLQAMEGETSTISEQLWALAADSRHSGMVLVSAVPLQQRALRGWMVGYAGRSEALNALYLQYGPTAKFDPTEMSSHHRAAPGVHGARCKPFRPALRPAGTSGEEAGRAIGRSRSRLAWSI